MKRNSDVEYNTQCSREGELKGITKYSTDKECESTSSPGTWIEAEAIAAVVVVIAKHNRRRNTRKQSGGHHD